MAASNDPISEGFITSLARPGGNFAGFSSQSADIVAKRFEPLTEMMAGSGPVAVMWDRFSEQLWRIAETSARAKKLSLVSVEITDQTSFEKELAAIKQAGAKGLLIFASSRLLGRRDDVVGMAAKIGIPTMFDQRTYVDGGGLM